ncbi:LacI family DNA-binding transcriptional regulator [Microbacterium sp. RD1]|uniref:LacI family DNA-binding transcriptional regulator n=1 Tax=Microbacterium sp. RD1 TaxID=3457313 RepID=UPI003FA5603F
MSISTPRNAVTIEEVAARAGVSRSTVSRVVNGSTAVSPEALEAVRDAIAALNYVPNRAARALARRQTHAIAFVIPEDTDRFFGDPFFASIVAGVHERIAQSDYVLNLIIASDDPHDKATTYLRSGSVDGVIIASHHTSDTFVDRIAADLPVVFGGRPGRITPTDYYVDIDNVGGGREAARYLAARGHRRVAAISGPQTMTSATDRLAGFREAGAQAGLEIVAVEDGDFSEEGAAAAMARILARGDELDALFVESDLMARGVLETLREAGVSVPDDIALIGFDDSPVATAVAPELTTIRQPSKAQGAGMADVLLALLAGREAPHATILPTELVIRDSA